MKFLKILFLGVALTGLQTRFISAQNCCTDGSLIVNSPNTVVNSYTALTNDATTGDLSLNVANAGIFAPGDLIFIIQMQGAAIDVNDPPNPDLNPNWGAVTNYNNSGTYEFTEVASAGGNTINLACALVNNYSQSGKTQVIKVPRYCDLTISNGGELTTSPWNGTTGGVLVVEVKGDVLIEAGGSINATGRGFRGGKNENSNGPTGGDYMMYQSTVSGDGAEKGESIAGDWTVYDNLGGRYCRGAPANGGGGGNNHNHGGGGGANAGNIAWTGTGNPDVSDPTWAQAWDLEWPGFSGSTSSGGGKGGYSFSGSDTDALTIGPNANSGGPAWIGYWGGSWRKNYPGVGGRPLDYSTRKLFMGGGGGAGHQNDNLGSRGGNGGGLVYIRTTGNISGNGTIIANGEDAPPTIRADFLNRKKADGAGGGGGGGTVVLEAAGAVSGIAINANGGKGGDQQIYVDNGDPDPDAYGPGGGGGGGYIALTNADGTVTKTADGGANGTTNSPSLAEFPPNGATSGGEGITNATRIIPETYTLTARNDTVCINTSASLSASINGAPPPNLSIQWYDSSGNRVGTGPVFTTPPLTQTTVYWVGYCPGTTECRVPDTAFVVTDLPVADAGEDRVICPGGNVQIGGNSDGTSYSWIPAATLDDTTISNPVARPVTSTTYFLTATKNTCSDTDTVVVNIINQLTTTITNDTTICAGIDLQLNASGGNTYSWMPGSSLSDSTIANPIASPVQTTTYIVDIDGGGCAKSDTVIVTVDGFVRADAGNDTVICSGNSGRIGGNSLGATYEWTPSASLDSATSGTPLATPSVTTTYTITVTNGNCVATDSMVLFVSQPLTVTASNDTGFCAGNSVQLSVQETGNYSYAWMPGNSLDDPASASPLASPTATTTYIVTVTDNEGGSCPGIDTVVVTVNNNIIADAGPDTIICEGTSATIGGNPTGPANATYIWDNTNSLDNAAISNPTATPSATTTYSVTVTDSAGCQGIDQAVVTITPLPQPDLGNDTILCNGQSLPLNAAGGVTYNWSPAAGLSDPSISDPIATPSSSTTYTVTVTDAYNCSNTENIIITVDSMGALSFTADDTGGCVPSTFSFNTPPIPGVSNYTWDFGDGNTGSGPDATNTYTAPGNYSVTLVATSYGGCTDSLVMQNYISVEAAPVADFVILPSNKINLADTGNLRFDNSLSSGGSVYIWDMGDGNTYNFNTTGELKHTYNEAGTYEVTLITTSAGGCSDTARHSVVIETNFIIYLPDVFTPNGDGLNDEFGPVGFYDWIEESSFTIWNRWGEKIYDADDLTLSWNGGYHNDKGKIVKDGAYVYLIKVTDQNGQKHVFKGNVVVLK